MTIEVKIPTVGESITSGIVSVWHKKSGEFVNEGEPLFTLETDKVSTEIVAQKAGVLETKVPEGQEVMIGEVVATIDDSSRSGEAKREATPKKTAEDKKKEREPEKKTVAAGDSSAVASAKADDRGGPESAPPATALSPAVRRIIEEQKLEPEKIHGTGMGGRLTKADVLAAAQKRGKAEPAKPVGEAVSFTGTAAPPSTTAQPSADGRFIRKKMSP